MTTREPCLWTIKINKFNTFALLLSIPCTLSLLSSYVVRRCYPLHNRWLSSAVEVRRNVLMIRRIFSTFHLLDWNLLAEMCGVCLRFKAWISYCKLSRSILLNFHFLFFFTLQFWAAYVPCEAQYKDAVQITLEQIDVIDRLTDRYSPQLTKCSSVYGN